MRGLRKVAYRHVDYKDGNIFVPLPRSLWRESGKCICAFCKGRRGYWDTLALPPTTDRNAYPYPVHYPELRKHRITDVERVPVTAALSRRITAGLAEIASINERLKPRRA